MTNWEGAKQVLVTAKSLISDKGWTQCAQAKDSEGNILYSIGSFRHGNIWETEDRKPAKPVCYCTHGAVEDASYSLSHKITDYLNSSAGAYEALYNTIEEEISIVKFDEADFQTKLDVIVDYNDDTSRTKQEVLDWFDRAIEYSNQ